MVSYNKRKNTEKSFTSVFINRLHWYINKIIQNMNTKENLIIIYLKYQTMIFCEMCDDFITTVGYFLVKIPVMEMLLSS